MPEPRRYLLTTHLEQIARMTGLEPGRVDPQEYDIPSTPRRGEWVMGYWLIATGLPLEGETDAEFAWELWTMQETQALRIVTEAEAFQLIRLVTQGGTP